MAVHQRGGRFARAVHADAAERQTLITALGWRALAGADPLVLTREALATMAQALGVERAVALSRRDDGTAERLAAVEGGVALADPGPAGALDALLLAHVAGGQEAQVVPAGVLGERPVLLVGLADERHDRPGAVALFTDDDGAISPADLDFVRTFATILGTTAARHRAAERVARLGLHDALTGLPNRALLLDRLGQALESGAREERATALLVLDVDHFRALNQAHGHATADEVLRALGARLAGTLGPGFTVARTGADEFAVLAPDAGGEASVVGLAERLAAVAAEPVLAGGHTMAISVSAGIALADPGDAEAERLLAAAEAGMLRARRRGGTRPELVTAAMRGEAARRVELERDLRRGLQDGEFVLHHQPIVDLADGALAGFEALLRWCHPQRGLLGPAAFLDVAEASGFIVELGDWIVAEACRTVAAWAAALPGRALVPVHVNVAAPQLAEPGFVGGVLDVLERTGIDPGLVVLELTESLLMEDRAALVEELRRLGALGLRVALDDFGTGYASLERLKRLPFHKLKIDRSFIAELPGDRRDASLVEAMVRLGRSLGLTVVAEGVQTPAQLAFLRDLGCEQAQGFHFGRPVPAGEALEHLRSGRRWAIDGAGGGARVPGEAPASDARPLRAPALRLGEPPVHPLPGLAEVLGRARARLVRSSWTGLYDDASGFFTDPGAERHRARWLDAVAHAARSGNYAMLAGATEALMAAAARGGAPLLERHVALERFGEAVALALAAAHVPHAEIAETRRLFAFLVERHLVASG